LTAPILGDYFTKLQHI